MKRSNGFTLVEMMIVMAIGTLLIVAAAPSFRAMSMNNRMTGELTEIVSALNLARMEALRRNRQVVLCASSNPTAATPSCKSSADKVGWEDGWIVFADPNRNEILDAGEELIRVNQGMGNGLIMERNGTETVKPFIAFAPSGGIAASSSGTFIICDDRGFAEASKITISFVGRIRSGDTSEILNGDGDCPAPYDGS